jgi:hypothetical protein
MKTPSTNSSKRGVDSPVSHQEEGEGAINLEGCYLASFNVCVTMSWWSSRSSLATDAANPNHNCALSYTLASNLSMDDTTQTGLSVTALPHLLIVAGGWVIVLKHQLSIVIRKCQKYVFVLFGY